MKLVISSWGTITSTLRSSALSLCYSAAEYCATVWSRFAHTSQVDVQLNSTMRLMSSTLHSTPLPWLSVLSNIELSLPALRGKADTDKVVEKIVKHDSLANPAWYPQPTIATTDIKETAVAELATSWHQKSMDA